MCDSSVYLFGVCNQSGYLTRIVWFICPAFPRYTIFGCVDRIQRVRRCLLIVFNRWADLKGVGQFLLELQKLTFRRHLTHTLALHISHWYAQTRKLNFLILQLKHIWFNLFSFKWKELDIFYLFFGEQFVQFILGVILFNFSSREYLSNVTQFSNGQF